MGDKQPVKMEVQIVVESISFEPKSLGELSHFFEKNKDIYLEIWIIISNRKVASPKAVSFNDVVSEAKKQGLIDSRIKNIDNEKYMIRLTKRLKPKF